MGWQYTPYLIVLGASGLLASAVAPVAWHHRDREGAVPLAVLMAAVTWWTLANAVGVAHTDLSGKRLAYRVMYLGVAVVPVAWIGFTVEYTGARVGRRDRLLGVAGIVPALTVPIALTNVRHGLLWREVWLVKDGPLVAMGVAYGPWFWVFTLVAYLLLAAGTLLLVRLVVLGEHVYRRQAAALLVAVLAPWAANAVYLADLTPPGIDPTPVGFAVSGLALLGSITRHRLLDTVPVAREIARNEVVEGLSDAVIVVDTDGRIVDLNPAAAALAGIDTAEVVGDPLESAFPDLATAIEDTPEGERVDLTLAGEDGPRHYDVRLSPLRRGYGAVSGRLISLRDVTERRRREERLDLLHRLLRHNLRNELTVVKGNARLVRTAIEDPDHRERLATVESVAEKLVDWGEKIRRATEESAGGNGPVDVVKRVDAVVERKRREAPEATVEVTALDAAHAAVGSTIDLALDEVVANAIEHGGGEVRIAVETEGERIAVRVADDGPGIPDAELAALRDEGDGELAHGAGVGLWLVAWVVRSSGGGDRRRRRRRREHRDDPAPPRRP